MAGDGMPYQHNRRYRHKLGHDVWGLAGLFVLHDADGAQKAFVVQVVDTTAIHQAEGALRKSEARFRDFAQSASDWFWEMGPDFRFTWFSDGHAYLADSDASAKVGQTRWEITCENTDNEKWKSHVADLKAHRPFRDFRYQITGVDGEIGHRSVSAVPVFDDEGVFLGYRGTASDISKLVKAENTLKRARDELENRVKERTTELEQSEERLRQAVELAGLGHYIWDTISDLCLYCSESYATIHGVTLSAYLERACTLEGRLEFTHPKDRNRIREALARLRAGQKFDMEYRTLSRDGQVRYVREIARPVFDDRGNVIQEVGTIQDITEKREDEERLRQALKMEAVGQLTGGVAHDFNNLLAVIHGNAELLAPDLDTSKHSIQAILRAAQRGAELTQRLLAFSRQQPLDPQSIDLAALVGGMTDLLNRTLGETVEIVTVVAPDLWTAKADAGQVENALLNLAINARDAMPNGGKLTIECGNARLDKAFAPEHPDMSVADYVALTVTDTGHGMTAETKAHAFEPFFTTKEVGKGSGLGLSMIYGFAKQSGGHVNIESAEGRGTTVTLYLPRAGEAAPNAKKVNESNSLPRGRGEAILLIEDDPNVRALMEKMVTGLGYSVIGASDAAGARAVLNSNEKIDLVLSDVVLPGGTSGPEFAKEARAQFPDLGVIFMSGYPAEAAEHNEFSDVGRILLNKPFQRQQLATVLRDAFL